MSVLRRCTLFSGTFLFGLCLSASAFAQDTFEVLKIDTSEFPSAKVYLQSPELGWEPAKAEMVMSEALDPDKAEALAAEILDRVENPPEETVAALPSPPNATSTARITRFADQSDPKEGRLIVFLVDASGSMDSGMPGSSHSRIQVTQKLMRAVVAQLNPSDKVTIVRFADRASPHLAPTPKSNGSAIQSSIDSFSNVTGGGTRIFDSLSDTIKRLDKEHPEPLLEGRRFFFVFSDGDDGGNSTLRAEDFQSTFDRAQRPPHLFTVSVGPEKQSKDLERLAHYAHDWGTFLRPVKDDPEARKFQDALAKAFNESSKALDSQLLVEFDLPCYYWSTGSHAGELRMPSTTGEEVGVDIVLPVREVDSNQSKTRQINLEAVDELWAGVASKAAMKKKFMMGGAALVLLGLAFFGSKKAKAIAAERESARSRDMEKIRDEMRSNDAKMRSYAEEQAHRAADASRKPLALLVAVDGALKGRRFGVLKARTSVGRDPQRADMVFPEQGGDAGISRVHAELVLADGGWMVTCMSPGGLWVSQSKVQNGEQYPLQYGDTLRMGKTSFRFERV